VEAHFRARYLAEAVKPELSVTLDGPASRTVQDRTIREAIRAAWEKERTFPAQLVNLIRPYFNTANLHVWKHRKRILFVSEVRPTRFNPDAQSVSEPIASLLRTIEENPKITRNGLSEKLFKPRESEADYEQLKTALAADLHWLIRAGHVIEFHDGTLDLPLPPKETGSPSKPTAPTAAAAEAESPATPETTPAAGADLGESAEELTTVPEPATPDASATPSVPAEAEEAALPKEEAAPDASLEAEQKSQDQGA